MADLVDPIGRHPGTVIGRSGEGAEVRCRSFDGSARLSEALPKLGTRESSGFVERPECLEAPIVKGWSAERSDSSPPAAPPESVATISAALRPRLPDAVLEEGRPREADRGCSRVAGAEMELRVARRDARGVGDQGRLDAVDAEVQGVVGRVVPGEDEVPTADLDAAGKGGPWARGRPGRRRLGCGNGTGRPRSGPSRASSHSALPPPDSHLPAICVAPPRSLTVGSWSTRTRQANPKSTSPVSKAGDWTVRPVFCDAVPAGDPPAEDPTVGAEPEQAVGPRFRINERHRWPHGSGGRSSAARHRAASRRSARHRPRWPTAPASASPTAAPAEGGPISSPGFGFESGTASVEQPSKAVIQGASNPEDRPRTGGDLRPRAPWRNAPGGAPALAFAGPEVRRITPRRGTRSHGIIRRIVSAKARRGSRPAPLGSPPRPYHEISTELQSQFCAVEGSRRASKGGTIAASDQRARVRGDARSDSRASRSSESGRGRPSARIASSRTRASRAARSSPIAPWARAIRA